MRNVWIVGSLHAKVRSQYSFVELHEAIASADITDKLLWTAIDAGKRSSKFGWGIVEHQTLVELARASLWTEASGNYQNSHLSHQ